MIERLKLILAKTLTTLLTPRASLLRLCERVVAKSKVREVEDAKAAAEAAVAAAVAAAPDKADSCIAAESKTDSVSVGIDKGDMSLTGVGVLEGTTGARLVSSAAKSAISSLTTGTVTTAIYLNAISDNHPGKLSITRELVTKNISHQSESRVDNYALVHIGIHSLTPDRKNGYKKVIEMESVDKLNIDSDLLKSFNITQLLSEYETFQAVRGFYGPEFPIEAYSKELISNALKHSSAMNQESLDYSLIETVDMCVEHSSPYEKNSLSLTATLVTPDGKSRLLTTYTVDYLKK